MLKTICKQLAPPALVSGVKWLLSKTLCANRELRWEGSFASWQEACAASEGYDAEGIFAKVVHAARQVRDGQCAYERDAVCFDSPCLNEHLTTAILLAALRSGDRLNVVDFGGGLGSTYQQNRIVLDHVPGLSWNVVEQSHVATCGKNEFATDVLSFWTSLEEFTSANRGQRIDVIIFSSVLQYLETPYAVLQQAIDLQPEVIYLGRTPLASEGDRLTVQHVPASIYRASYPCWLLDKKRIEALLAQNYTYAPWVHSSIDPEFFMETFAWRAGINSR